MPPLAQFLRDLQVLNLIFIIISLRGEAVIFLSGLAPLAVRLFSSLAD
jgi:hypothetical protein